jgi:DNA-binding MarR family transcriptional regulator
MSSSDRQTLAVLETVEQSSEATQRQIASTTGLSLGLVNAIVKDLAKRGMIKMRQVPRRRLLYYLTPQGFTEKSALLLRVIRTVQNDYQHIRRRLFQEAVEMKNGGRNEIVLKGDPFLLEIGCICCLEVGIQVKGLYSEKGTGQNICGHFVKDSKDLGKDVKTWELEFSLLGLARDLAVERSRLSAQAG